MFKQKRRSPYYNQKKRENLKKLFFNKKLIVAGSFLLISAAIFFADKAQLFKFWSKDNSNQSIISNQQSTDEVQAEGQILIEKGRYQEAEKVFENLTEKDPTNPDYQANLAISLYNQNKFSQAQEAYNIALADHKDAYLFNGLGNVLRDWAGSLNSKKDAESAEKRAELIKQAESNYQEAIKLDKKYVAAYNNLAQLLLDQQRIKEAKEILKIGLEKNPGASNLTETLRIISQ